MAFVAGIAAVLIVATAAGCAQQPGNTAVDSQREDQDSVNQAPLIRTDRDSYRIWSVHGGPRFVLRTVLINRLDYPLYVTKCSGWALLGLEKRVGNEWVAAYMLPCLLRAEAPTV